MIYLNQIKKLCISCFLILTFLVFVPGCTENVSQDGKNAEDIARAFLESFYSLNVDGRYEKMTGDIADAVQAEQKNHPDQQVISIPDEEALTIAGRYYGDLFSFCSEDLQNELLRTQIPFRYEALVMAADAKVAVSEVQCSADQQTDSWHYTVIMEREQDGEKQKLTAIGKIQMTKAGDDWLAASLTVNRISREDGSIWQE